MASSVAAEVGLLDSDGEDGPVVPAAPTTKAVTPAPAPAPAGDSASSLSSADVPSDSSESGSVSSDSEDADSTSSSAASSSGSSSNSANSSDFAPSESEDSDDDDGSESDDASDDSYGGRGGLQRAGQPKAAAATGHSQGTLQLDQYAYSSNAAAKPSTIARPDWDADPELWGLRRSGRAAAPVNRVRTPVGRWRGHRCAPLTTMSPRR